MTDQNGFMPAGMNDVEDSSTSAGSTPAKAVYSEQEITDQECAEFQALMAERIGAGEDIQSYPHMLTCERCRALVSELEFIADFARQLIPKEEEPREELWDKIQFAIEHGEA